MVYDLVVIGAGLGGFSAALAAKKSKKEVLVVAKGMGNLYQASGYIDLIGYYPSTAKDEIINPLEALDKLIKENPGHPYKKIGKDFIQESFQYFLEISAEMGLPYTGSLEKNMLLPSAAGALVPTCLYPEKALKNVKKAEKIVVVGIKELIDFYPGYTAHNLEKQLNKKINFVWVELGIKVKRELNSYDLALTFENDEIRKNFINQLNTLNLGNCLLLIPAILGVKKWEKVITDIENNTGCQVLEIPTLPPSVMGYRLAEVMKDYLRKKGVDFIIGYPVTNAYLKDKVCEEVGILTPNGRVKKIKGKSFVLATGGILGEGLKVYPEQIKEEIFNLPVICPKKMEANNFFNLEGEPLAYCGVDVNEKLQPINPTTGETVLKNVFVAGATLTGYDPFVEKSGNGVALASGYKAGIMAAGTGGDRIE